jgi:hypothetical protein
MWVLSLTPTCCGYNTVLVGGKDESIVELSQATGRTALACLVHGVWKIFAVT